MILAEATGTIAQWALLVTALGGVLGVVFTFIAGRRPAVPPSPHDDNPDPGALWRELLEQLDAAGERADREAAAGDEWRGRYEECNTERLDLLRRLARGDAP